MKVINAKKIFWGMFLFFPMIVNAKPMGGNILHGDFVEKENKSHIEFVVSDGAIIEWDNFSIDKEEAIHFILPDTSCRVLCRVSSDKVSELAGDLYSNGRIFLINKNGLILEKGTSIRSSSFVGSTFEILDNDFIQGKYTFTGNSSSPILNQGALFCNENIFWIQNKFENYGLLQAGNIFVIAGETEIELENDLSAISGKQTENSENKDSSINNQGIVQTTASNGNIYFKANKGLISNNNLLKAENGLIKFLGDTILLQKHSLIDASGDLNGGNVYIGGEWQGANNVLPNANFLFMHEDAQILANAHRSGNGGTVVLWANNKNVFLGSISAKGGVLAGDGGNIEVSGKGLDYRGTIDVSSLTGKSGSLLLDPITITVQSSGPNIDGLGLGHDITSVGQLSSPSDYATVNSVIISGALNALLTGGVNLTLAAYDSITIDDPITAAGTITTFNLNAPVVNLNQPITFPSGGSLSGTANIVNVGGSGIIQNGVDIATNGASINIDTGTYVQEVHIEGKNITLNGQGIGNTIIQSPSILNNSFIYTTTSAVYKPIIMVQNASIVNIENLTVDGNDQGKPLNDKFLGIGYHNAGGFISNIKVTRIEDSFPAGGAQRGIGILGAVDTGTYTLHILDSVIDFFQKGGITIRGSGLTGNISGNTITGSIPSPIATANGLTIQENASGIISSNVISNIISSTPGVDSVGILPFGAGANLSLIGNIVRNNDIGIYAVSSGDQLTISYNTASMNGNVGIGTDTPLGSTQIQSNTITNNGNQGVYLTSPDNSAFALANNVIVGSSEGLVVEGTGTQGPVITMNGDVFTTIGDKYVQMINCPNDIWNSTETVKFDGLVFGEMSYLQFLGLLDKIVDQHNNPSLGLVVDFVPPSP